MKVAPVSADLLIKLGIAAAACAAAWAAFNALRAAVPSAGAVADGIASAANAINPLNDNNLISQAANAAASAASGVKDNTAGGWLYDLTHPAPDLKRKPPVVMPALDVTPAAIAYGYELS